MNCAEIQNKISTFIDGECSEQEKKEILTHLSLCPECNESYLLTKSLIEKLNDIEEIEVPEGFHQELMQKIHTEMPSRKIKFTRFNRHLSIVAAVFVAVIIFSVIGVQMLMDWGSLGLKKSDRVARDETAYEYTTTQEAAKSSEVVEEVAIEFAESTNTAEDAVIEEETEMEYAAKADIAENSTIVEDTEIYTDQSTESQLTQDGTDDSFNSTIDTGTGDSNDLTEEDILSNSAEQNNESLSITMKSAGTDESLELILTDEEDINLQESKIKPGTIIILLIALSLFVIPTWLFRVTRRKPK